MGNSGIQSNLRHEQIGKSPANNLGNSSIQRNTLQSSPTCQIAEMFSSSRMVYTHKGLRDGSCHLCQQDTEHPGPAILVPGGHPANQPTDTWGRKTCGTQIPPGDTSSKDKEDTCRRGRTPHRKTPGVLAAGQKTPHQGTLEPSAIRI